MRVGSARRIWSRCRIEDSVGRFLSNEFGILVSCFYLHFRTWINFLSAVWIFTSFLVIVWCAGASCAEPRTRIFERVYWTTKEKICQKYCKNSRKRSIMQSMRISKVFKITSTLRSRFLSVLNLNIFIAFSESSSPLSLAMAQYIKISVLCNTNVNRFRV